MNIADQNRIQHPAEFNVGEFREAFRVADYQRCHALLESSLASPSRDLWAARLALREKRYADAIQLLSALKPLSSRDKVERDVVLGTAFGLTRDFEVGVSRLNRATRELAANDPLYLEALYGKALIAWMQHDNRLSESLLQRLLAAGDPNERAHAHALLSWIAVRRGDVRGQIDHLRIALQELETTHARNIYYQANALTTLAMFCRELPLGELTQRVRQLYGSMPWTNGISSYHFKSTRLLGWIDALSGDELSAFRRFRLAADLAPSDHWRVLCLIDRAYLARSTGERAFATDQLYAAHEHAAKLSWNETADEERAALIVMAELFADVDAALAQRYLAQFRSIGNVASPLLPYGEDPRVRAFALYSAGVALTRLGEPEDAQPMLRDAFETFDAYEYGWRAALCALALGQLTNDPRWMVQARHRIAPWPRSWIAREISSAPVRKATEELVSNAQRQVLRLVLTGKRNTEIAAELGRSPNTVRNHIAEIFKAYNVRSRSELIALFSGRSGAA